MTSGAQASSGGCSCRTAGVETRSYRVFALLGFVMVALRLRKRRSMTGAEGDGGTSTVTGAVRKPMVEITAPECSSPSASTGTPMGFWLGTGQWDGADPRRQRVSDLAERGAISVQVPDFLRIDHPNRSRAARSEDRRSTRSLPQSYREDIQTYESGTGRSQFIRYTTCRDGEWWTQEAK